MPLTAAGLYRAGLVVILTEPVADWALCITTAGERALAEHERAQAPALEAALARGGLDAPPPECACGRLMDYTPAAAIENRRGELVRFQATWVCACGAARNV